MSFEIAKAGWLFRQSSVLRRWKKNWFVLYTDGTLKYFDSPNSHVAEEAVLIPVKLLVLKTAHQLTDVTPPQGLDRDCLLSLVTSNQTWVLSAESHDDMRAWQLAIEDARVIHSGGRPQVHYGDCPPPYNATVHGYPVQTNGCGYYGRPHPPSYVMQSPPGQTTTVIYADNNPYYYNRRYYDGSDVALGMVAGAAVGSMMWGPLLWW